MFNNTLSLTHNNLYIIDFFTIRYIGLNIKALFGKIEMFLKLFQDIKSSVENEILSSFNDVVIRNDNVLNKRFGDQLIPFCRLMIKRTIDLTVSFLLILINLPIFIIIGILIKISSKGTVFFKQERVGYQGKVFKIWKFRTMRQENSESEHRDIIQGLLHKEESIDGTDLLTKYITYIDSRTTPIGRFLRATSLDELPQLFNIFSGYMSLVGPRPHPLYEVEEYKKWYHRRLSVKPGLTGWSKLNLRCTPQNYEEAILYDLWYVDHWNLILDLRILFMTVPFVLLMKDAH